MDEKLLPLSRDELVSSFINIAQGETMDRAKQFLNEKKWCLEDALDLYYTGKTNVAGPPCPLPDADVVHNVVTNSVSPAIKLQSAKDSSAVSTQRPSNSISDQFQLFQRRKRRTHAQMGKEPPTSSPLPSEVIHSDHANGVATPTSSDLTTCPHHCALAQMDRDASMAKPRGARRKRRTPTQINYDASTSNPHDTYETRGLVSEMSRDALENPESMCSTSGSVTSVDRHQARTPYIENADDARNFASAPNFVQRRHRRTRSEIVADSLTGNRSVEPQKMVLCRRRRSKMEMSLDA